MENEIVIKRFTEVRRDLGFTQAEFAGKLGIPSTTADIERGRTRLTGKVVAELLRLYRINPLWLYGESTKRYLDTESVSVMPKVVSVDSAENENILLVNAKAAAGYPQNIQDTSWYRKLPAFDLPLPQFRNASYRGFQVEGDSMLPNLSPGDWVLARGIENWDDINGNRIYVIVLKDAVVVKKIEKIPGTERVRMISLNGSYLPYEVDTKDIQEVWLVSSKITFGLEATTENGLLRELKQSMEELKEKLGAS
ncbi:XRE family transcriptional regulator [Robiginitalea aurantiaca]|uniref:LexA family transcriptional regulator n=1 Tax=Robiginitalea aurantiaca TaxID=3056915 RepID=A0ABT7WFR5_9FLAO|nr:LexA family transcriptional regulator [Robiginitalea aurantiaca]MDM9631659.1 LexA family transcriptional regulator [Robiginitalea aurantiaca]